MLKTNCRENLKHLARGSLKTHGTKHGSRGNTCFLPSENYKGLSTKLNPVTKVKLQLESFDHRNSTFDYSGFGHEPFVLGVSNIKERFC